MVINSSPENLTIRSPTGTKPDNSKRSEKVGTFSFLAEMVSKYRDGDTGLGHFSSSLSDSEALSIHLQCGSVSEVKVEPGEAESHEFFFLKNM